MSTPTRRRGDPDTTYDYNAADGTLVTLRSDAEGVVDVRTENESAAADAFGMTAVEPVRKGRKAADTPTDESAGEPAEGA